MLDKETIKYLDSLSDKELALVLNLKFGEYIPQWERCTKEEYVNVDADGVVCFGHWKNDLRKAMKDE